MLLEDLCTELTWPEAYLYDTAYALLRPLYSISSPWRKDLNTYLYGQVRRLGGKQYLLFYFSTLSMLTEGYAALTAFLKEPFTDYDSSLFKELEAFLYKQFKEYPTAPWRDGSSSLPPKGNASNTLIDNIFTECTSLVKKKSNIEMLDTLLSFPVHEVYTECNKLTTIPVILYKCHLSNELYSTFERKGVKLYRILHNYIRWDDAQVLLTKGTIDLTEKSLHVLGEPKEVQVNNEDYFLYLLVSDSVPKKYFTVADWDVNTRLIIIKNGDVL